MSKEMFIVTKSMKKMAEKQGIHFPKMADAVGLTCDKFEEGEVYETGNGECYTVVRLLWWIMVKDGPRNYVLKKVIK